MAQPVQIMSPESATAVVAIALLLVIAAWAIPIYRRVQHWMAERPKPEPGVGLREIREQILKLQASMLECFQHPLIVSNNHQPSEEQVQRFKEVFNDPIVKRIDTVIDKLMAVDGRLAEFLAGQRQVLRAMYGTGGTEDDEIIEQARVLQERYPGLSLEDAISRVRALKTYSPRG